jgi:hypothetical protein
MSNYYNYIVVDCSYAFTFIRDMKYKYKLDSKIIYYGDIMKYGSEEGFIITDFDKLRG